jgi:hypothetical protein
MMSKKDCESELDQVQKDIADSDRKMVTLHLEAKELSNTTVETMDDAKSVVDRRRELQDSIESQKLYRSDRERRLAVLKDILFSIMKGASVLDGDKESRG